MRFLTSSGFALRFGPPTRPIPFSVCAWRASRIQKRPNSLAMLCIARKHTRTQESVLYGSLSCSSQHKAAHDASSFATSTLQLGGQKGLPLWVLSRCRAHLLAAYTFLGAALHLQVRTTRDSLFTGKKNLISTTTSQPLRLFVPTYSLSV